jgi:hypothetical protein
MNLQLAYKILQNAEDNPAGVLKVRGREAAHEVVLMAEAGLVRAEEPIAPDSTEAVITRITHAGHQFYRAFRNLRSFPYVEHAKS